MINYQDVIYGNYKKSDYSLKLASHLLEEYDFKPFWSEWCLEECNKLLEVGFGSGEYLNAFAQLGFETFGIEYDSFYYQGSASQTYEKTDFNKDRLPYEDNFFSHVFCKSVLEHLQNPQNLLTEIHRILKKDGKLIILLPSWEYNYRWFYDDPTHIKPFNRKGLQDLLRMSGFSLPSINIEYFYHLPIFWNFPVLKPIAKLIRILPDDYRWKDWEQQNMNIFIRFAKEVQLLGVVTK